MYKYDRKNKEYELLCIEEMEAFISRLKTAFSNLCKFVQPLEYSRLNRAKELKETTISEFGSESAFIDYRNNLQSQLMNVVADRQSKYLQTKQKF